MFSYLIPGRPINGRDASSWGQDRRMYLRWRTRGKERRGIYIHRNRKGYLTPWKTKIGIIVGPLLIVYVSNVIRHIFNISIVKVLQILIYILHLNNPIGKKKKIIKRGKKKKKKKGGFDFILINFRHVLFVPD